MKESKREKNYELLRAALLELIKKEGLNPDDKLPTVREIIRDFKFSYATVHRTIIEMENEGIITARQGKGVYVRKIPDGSSTKEVALIFPAHFSSHKIFIDVLNGVKTALGKERIGLLISITDMSHEKEREAIDKLVSRHVDGLIIFLEDNYRRDYSHIKRLKERNFPFVLIDRYIRELETDYVVVNNTVAVHRICAYLKYAKKCDDIVFVPEYGRPSDISSSEEKLTAFKDAMTILYNNTNPQIIELDELAKTIRELSASCMNLGISVNHDTMLTDLLTMLKERGEVLPPNCHLFGYNNSFESPMYPTVEQFNELVGSRAAEILIERMKNPTGEVIHERIEPKLLIPDSEGRFGLDS